jgi:hypothetical protein
MRVCRSPKLIAAYHGLHRLRVPRHPPHAFTRLTTTICDQAERPTIFQQHHLSSEQSKTNSIEIERCSIRILKSAIYHAFRCQIALTLIVRQPPEGSDRLTGDFQPIKRSVALAFACARDSRHLRDGRPTRVSVKEVIQPQVPLRLPCYDFAPVTALAFGRLAPCGF